jgi:response regulator NasT
MSSNSSRKRRSRKAAARPKNPCPEFPLTPHAAAKEMPVILVSAFHDPALPERAGVAPGMAYLVTPVRQGDGEAALALAVHRFAPHPEVRREAESLRPTLQGRKVIERARGVVMRRLGVSADEA